MLNYEVEVVNSILNSVYTSSRGSSSYNLPLSETDPDRIAFDSWLEVTGIEDGDVSSVNWATACLRMHYISLFSCNSCECIPPIMLYMGFGVTTEEKAIFNTNSNTIIDYCC